MRSPLRSLFYKSPFENVKRHSEKVSECARLFYKAVECHLEKRYEEFENLRDTVAQIESEADAIKRNIRGHLPKGVLMPVDKFQLFSYLREQDKVLDVVENALFWLSYRPDGFQDEMKGDIQFFVGKVLPVIEKLSPLADMATNFFRSNSREDRDKIKSLIRDIRQHEHEADHLERELKEKIFANITDPLQLFHLIRLVEMIGSIADHAQNASDMMRAMIAE